MDAPRIHDQASNPPTIAAERAIPADVRATLSTIGHRVIDLPPVAAVAAVGLDASGRPVAAGDRRKDGGEAVVER